MIPKIQFGGTHHQSSRIIFGGYALSSATKEEVDDVLDLLLKYGINHIDTARIYGKSEENIGPWMEKHRACIFWCPDRLVWCAHFDSHRAKIQMRR